MRIAVVTFLVCMVVSFGAKAQSQQVYNPYAPAFAPAYYPMMNYFGYPPQAYGGYHYRSYGTPRRGLRGRGSSRSAYHPRIPQQHPGDYRDAVDRGNWAIRGTGTNFPYTR